MKKLVLSLTAICAAVTLNAQNDTIREFFTGTPVSYGAQGGGYVAGNNSYGDIAKFQRFDATHGISGNGMITGCLLWVAGKTDGGGSFNVVVRDYAGGTAGADLATATVNLAAVDTSAAGFMIAEAAVGYNVAVTFSSPVAVTSASDLLIGIVLPTTTGDTIGLVTNTHLDFADAATHTWEQWSNNSYNAIGDPANWTLAIALAVYPTVTWGSAGVTENTITAEVYPNPANDVLNVTTSGKADRVSILSLDGKVVSSQEMNGTSATVNVAGLNSGAYIYEVTAADGSAVRNTFMKK